MIIMRRIGGLIAASALIAGVAAGASAQGFTMKIATSTVNDTQHEWMKRFKATIESRAPDKLKVELFPSGMLGDGPAITQGVQLGTIESFTTPSAFLVGVDPRNQVLNAFGLFQDIPHCWRTISTDKYRDLVGGLMRDKGILVIGWMCTAPQAFLTKKQITKLDDFKGLKIRVLATDFEIKPMQAIGINPTPMPFTEVMPGLQQNLIDGLSSIPILFNNAKMFTAAKHITLIGLINWPVPVYVSRVWWEKLPADLQRTMQEEARKLEPGLMAWNAQANETALEAWRKEGGTATKLPDADHMRLHQIARVEVEKVIASRPPVEEFYRAVRAIAETTK